MKPSTPADFSEGDRVRFTPFESAKQEDGTVTSTNGRWVFVRYDESLHDRGVATNPGDLKKI